MVAFYELAGATLTRITIIGRQFVLRTHLGVIATPLGRRRHQYSPQMGTKAEDIRLLHMHRSLWVERTNACQIVGRVDFEPSIGIVEQVRTRNA